MVVVFSVADNDHISIPPLHSGRGAGRQAEAGRARQERVRVQRVGMLGGVGCKCVVAGALGRGAGRRRALEAGGGWVRGGALGGVGGRYDKIATLPVPAIECSREVRTALVATIDQAE